MQIKPIANMVGHKTNKLFFDDLEIPADALIGKEGRGFWARIFATLAAQAELPDDLSIDSTAVRAHRSAHGGKGGRTFRPSGARVAVRPAKSTP